MLPPGNLALRKVANSMTFPSLNSYANFLSKNTRWSSFYHALIVWWSIGFYEYLSTKNEWTFIVVSMQNDRKNRSTAPTFQNTGISLGWTTKHVCVTVCVWVTLFNNFVLIKTIIGGNFDPLSPYSPWNPNTVLIFML